MNPAKADQVGSLGVNGRLLICPRCKWDPSLFLNKVLPGAQAGRRSKKKSRKHQRCMVRRMLERKQRLGRGVEDKTLGMASSLSKSGRKQGQKVGQLTMEETRENITTLCPAMSLPSAGTARQCPSSRDRGNAIPLPVCSAADADSLSYPTPKSRKPVAIDCEMVGTGPAGKVSELARCSVVSYDGDVIYDKYIRPQLPVVDYRTRWSGVTRQHMAKATPFTKARAEILQILKDKIVVGHALHNDFRALKYFHPREWTRDTSQSHLLRERGGLPLKSSASLKSLAQRLLNRQIQVSRKGHSSVEDAQASMELYRLVEMHWEKDMTSRLAWSPANGPPVNCTDNDHYMDDQYWPDDLNLDCK